MSTSEQPEQPRLIEIEPILPKKRPMPESWRVGQRLTAYFVDECHRQDRRDMLRLKGQVAQHARRLIENGATLEEAKQALREFVHRHCQHALSLAEISVELYREQHDPPAQRPSVRRAAKDWIAEHGWPTGARFVRGETGGRYIYDPLGLDRGLPSDWPHGRPSFEEIAEALAAH